MTAFADARTAMRTQAGAQITGAGAACNVLRLSPVADDTGRKTGSYASILASGTTIAIWIQPAGGASDVRQQGIAAETTHLAYQPLDGTALLAKDRILPSGETYAYDVIRPQVFETHRRAELKQVRRS